MIKPKKKLIPRVPVNQEDTIKIIATKPEHNFGYRLNYDNDNHLVKNPNGVSFDGIGISRTKDDSEFLYGNSDTDFNKAALTAILKDKDTLMDYYNLSPDEFQNLLANVHGLLTVESSGGYPTRFNENGEIEKNDPYYRDHFNEYFNYARYLTNKYKGTAPSEGAGMVKYGKRGSGTHVDVALSDYPIDFTKYDVNGPTHAGLSAFSKQAGLWKVLQDDFFIDDKDKRILYNPETGQMSDVANALLRQAYKQGLKYKEDGEPAKIWESYQAQRKDKKKKDHLSQYAYPEMRDKSETDPWYADKVKSVIDAHNYGNMAPTMLNEVVITPEK